VTAQRRPGPSLALSLIVLGVGIVVAVVGGVETALPFIRTLTQSTSHATPAQIRAHLSHGTYEVYELTGDRSSAFSPVRPGSVDLAPSDVTVTPSGGGAPLPVTGEGADETLTLGTHVYTGAVQFAVPRAGDYVVRVTSGRPTRVVLARSLGGLARSVVGWIITAAAGGLLALIGLTLLIVGLVRRRSRPVAATGGAPGMPPPNWYADPSDPDRQRYWDGRQWTDQTHRP
jgi:Protein of unknown function (DUF2510)